MKGKNASRKILQYIGAVLGFSFIIYFAGVRDVKIQADTINELKVTSVSDISSITGDITYQTIGLPSTSKCATMKLTVPETGLVKIITSATDLTANYIESDGTTQKHNLKVATRIYRNAGCVDQAGSEVTAYRNQNSDTGAVFLSKGVYYIQFEGTDPDELDTSLSCSVMGTVKAAVFYQAYTDNQGKAAALTLKQVTDLANSSDFDSYQQITLSNVSKCATAKITLDKPGAVKLITNASNITVSYTENGAAKTEALHIATRLYRNSACTKQIGKDADAYQNKSAETGIFYLEKGTYYIQYDATNAVQEGILNGTVQAAALYQAYTTKETVPVSTKDQRNSLSWAKVQKGFLSDLSGTDYYQFKVTSLNPVKLWCRTYEEGKTTIQLYNSSFERIASASGSGSMEQIGFEKYLNTGTYYVKVTSSAKGTYEMKLMKQSYHLTLSYKLPVVSVHTVTDYAEIRYLKGSYYNIDLDSAKWNKGTVLGKNKTTFTVNQKGYYTVRVTDAKGTMFLKLIYISKVDNVKPAKPSVTSYKQGSAVIKGKAEKNSTIYVQINSYKTVHKGKVSAKGTYSVSLDYYLFKGDIIKVYAVDKAGNKSTVRRVKVK